MATLDTERDLLLARKEYFARNASAGTLDIAPDEPLYVAVRFTGDIAARSDFLRRVSFKRSVAKASAPLTGQ